VSLIAFLRGLFRLENLALLIVIIGAIITLTPLREALRLSQLDAMVALLGVLAVDALVERVGALKELRTTLANINVKLIPSRTISEYFQPRTSHPQFNMLLSDATEVWIAAKGLKALWTDHSGQILEAAKSGVRFRFLLHDPESQHVIQSMAATSLTSTVPKHVRTDIRIMIDHIVTVSRSCTPGQILLHVTPWPMTHGCTIVNPTMPKGRAYIELWGYKLALAERRAAWIYKELDHAEFAFYVADFERQWNDARVIISDSPMAHLTA
jgi:hypothetical protein